MRVVFLGTPSFGVPALTEIAKWHEVVACVCQPDKAGARGKTEYCAVKKFALANGLPLFQFEKISRDGAETLRSLAPDIMVTAAYGQILSQEIIDIAPHGIINIHGSLLPKLRGAAPIQYAVLSGLTRTGITILNTVRQVDAGEIILQKPLDILPYETNGELFERLSHLGAEAVVEALELIQSGKAVYAPQNEEEATFCSKIAPEKERIDWNDSAVNVVNLVRALSPSPSAYTTYSGKRLKIYALRLSEKEYEGQAGQVVECGKKTLAVMCGDGRAVNIVEIQAENSKRMDIASFLCGRKLPTGAVLGE
ncbi:MAG: methionyl-tRNA formyltransferase [Corallococcus sp.]|nr:methionyl-tRNA formyltransferase [Bacillota bacterium]MCM1533560.1 methionyl-tRNA formyltransferase [Corallococcus sp.]